MELTDKHIALLLEAVTAFRPASTDVTEANFLFAADLVRLGWVSLSTSGEFEIDRLVLTATTEGVRECLNRGLVAPFVPFDKWSETLAGTYVRVPA